MRGALTALLRALAQHSCPADRAQHSTRGPSNRAVDPTRGSQSACLDDLCHSRGALIPPPPAAGCVCCAALSTPPQARSVFCICRAAVCAAAAIGTPWRAVLQCPPSQLLCHCPFELRGALGLRSLAAPGPLAPRSALSPPVNERCPRAGGAARAWRCARSGGGGCLKPPGASAWGGFRAPRARVASVAALPPRQPAACCAAHLRPECTHGRPPAHCRRGHTHSAPLRLHRVHCTRTCRP